MASFNCFCGLGGGKKDKGEKRRPKTADAHVTHDHPVGTRYKVKVMNHESPVKAETEEMAYEGEDESLSTKGENSNFDLQACIGNSKEEIDQSFTKEVNDLESFGSEMRDQSYKKSENDGEEDFEFIANGHISDPAMMDSFKKIADQWTAFPEDSSPLSRVDKWIKELTMEPIPFLEKDNHPSPARSSVQLTQHHNTNIPEEVTHANSVIQSLNSSSSVAHIAGVGLKVIPNMSSLSSLRSINLSGNFIAHITHGSLPKGLHILNLSRNKITTVEGLRGLTRLRVLDLSYNKISRIGQGLSNCTLIKELYLGGNKISDVEGLHRLLKLSVLDLSFNRITTTKALGQLVANYNSLLALNLLGNPIQNNISDDQLRKTVCSLLPKVSFLNKQPINPQKAREVGKDAAVAKAALGSSRGKATKRVSRGISVLSGVHRSTASVSHKTKHRARTSSQHHSSKTKPSDLASASR